MTTVAAHSPPRRAAATHWRLKLLDGFDLSFDNSPVVFARSAQRLVSMLALGDRPVARSYASGVLWSDRDSEHANACLRSAIWRTRSPGRQPVVIATPTHVSLASWVEVDFRSSVARSRRVLSTDGSAAELPIAFDELDELCAELLPDWYDDWVLLERERYRQLQLHTLERLSDRFRAAGRFAESLHVALTAVASDPLRESAQRRVIDTHLAEGNLADALRQYRRYARLLAAELGLQPSGDLRQYIETLSA